MCHADPAHSAGGFLGQVFLANVVKGGSGSERCPIHSPLTVSILWLPGKLCYHVVEGIV